MGKVKIKITNTTVFNTDDIMHYVNSTKARDLSPNSIRIRYINNPSRAFVAYNMHTRKSSYVNRWVKIMRKSKGVVEIGLLRLNKQLANVSPIEALAAAAEDCPTAPSKLGEDLSAALSKNTLTYGEARVPIIPVRVATRPDKIACAESALVNLRKKVKGKEAQIAWQKRDLIAQKDHLEHLKKALPKLENETIPAGEAELVKMRKLLQRREKEARALGIVV